MIVLHAGALEDIEVDDVKRAAIGMHVLPANIEPPKAIPDPAAETPTEGGQTPPDPESSAELAQGPDS
jgi:hypothetical protein